jgi:hypothetical protein
VINLPHRAPFSPVIAQLGRVLAASLRLPGDPPAPLPYDPVFLPDFATLTPDQAQEMRYGRRRPMAHGGDR